MADADTQNNQLKNTGYEIFIGILSIAAALGLVPPLGGWVVAPVVAGVAMRCGW